MPIYQELYNKRYTLKTGDIDFAVSVAHGRTKIRSDLNILIQQIGFTDFITGEGLQKFTAGGFEVEFVVHRKGGSKKNSLPIHEWNISAQPLPFLNILIDNSDTAKLHDFIIRYPVAEAFFLHKTIISQKRNKKAKKEKDLEQCRILTDILEDSRLQAIFNTYRLSSQTKRYIRTSCETIGFPLHRLNMK
jgi:hypothetical protein